MSVQKEIFLDELRTASPLEATQILQDIELYDAKSSQEIIDEVYEQFASGENMTEEIVKPVFMSVVDGLLEATASGRAARKKGLTASRVLKECEAFSYTGSINHGTNVDGYIETKNVNHSETEYMIGIQNGEFSEDDLLRAYNHAKGNRREIRKAIRTINKEIEFCSDSQKLKELNVKKNKLEVNAEICSMKMEYYQDWADILYEGKTNKNTSQLYDRDKVASQSAMNAYKKDSLKGEKLLEDEYTGKKNIYLEQLNPDKRRNDPKHDYQAEPDHIVPLKQIHDSLRHNYALDDNDIRRIANRESNLAMTSAELNGRKLNSSNSEFIRKQEAIENELKKIRAKKDKLNKKSQTFNSKEIEEKLNSLNKKEKQLEEDYFYMDDDTKARMLLLEKRAQKSIDNDVNSTVFNNLVGKGLVDDKEKKQVYKEEAAALGRKLTAQEKLEIDNSLSKKKQKEIIDNTVENASEQAKDYAVGNLILFIVKPIYFELTDAFKNGLQEGCGATSGVEALSIRFGRVKTYVMKNAAVFLGENAWDFVKGFVSSLIEGIISLFVGVFKQVLKLLKEGIKIFVESAKVLFGKDAENMSPAEKGDAIIKIIGGSVIAIAGIGIEALLNKIGIGEPWSIVLSTMLSGIAAALFMYLLNKADIFSVKAEKRHDRIIEIFDERIKDIEEARNNFDIAAVELLQNQKLEFESISGDINLGLEENNILKINEGLYRMASFMNVDLPYSNTEEFCEYMDSEEVLVL